jgi:integron integrase
MGAAELCQLARSQAEPNHTGARPTVDPRPRRPGQHLPSTPPHIRSAVGAYAPSSLLNTQSVIPVGKVGCRWPGGPLDGAAEVEEREMKLLDQVRTELRRLHYAYQTEKAYCRWIVHFIRFHDYTHPQQMGEEAVLEFLNHLAGHLHVAASTQNQALNALNFLYGKILRSKLGDLDGRLVRARRPQSLPVVLSRSEIASLFEKLRPPYLLMAQLLYGAGLRRNECLALRVKDVEFDTRALVIREPKGGRDRRTVLPDAGADALRRQIDRALTLMEKDRRTGNGGASLPSALERKYPSARFTPTWQYVFPAQDISVQPRTGLRRRHHAYPQTLQRAIQ